MSLLTSHGGDPQRHSDGELDLRSLQTGQTRTRPHLIFIFIFINSTESERLLSVKPKSSRSTHRCDHDGVVQETEADEGDAVVQQNCGKKKKSNHTKSGSTRRLTFKVHSLFFPHLSIKSRDQGRWEAAGPPTAG